jgi:hypothetical protein
MLLELIMVCSTTKERNAIALGFNSIYIDGISFHFKEFDILNDPTMLGTEKALTTGIGCLIYLGGTTATIDGVSTCSLPSGKTQSVSGAQIV